MDKKKLDYFRNLLLQQRRQALEHLRVNRAIALEDIDGVDDIWSGSERALVELSY